MGNTASSSLLLAEHLALGAHIGNFGPMEQVPLSYPSEAPEMSCSISDLSGMLLGYLRGADAVRLAELVFAGKKLEVGSCACEAALSGDGSLVGVPLVLRTGDTEYLVCDISGRQDLLGDWILWTTNLTTDDGPAFKNCSFKDVTETVVPLLLTGDRAPELLNDYLTEGQELPSVGVVLSLTLDETPCLLASLVLNDKPAYLLFLPPSRARIFWRSFLSFSYVGPLGLTMLRDKMIAHAAWVTLLDTEDRISLDVYQLIRWHLLRSDSDYIGHRGLVGE